MIRHGKTRRALWTVVIAVACLLIAGPSLGQGRRSSAAPAAMSEDLVSAVNVTVGSIELGGTTYKVDSRSRLLDVAGRRIRLGDLSDGRDGGQQDMVAYQVQAANSGRKGALGRIVSLQVMEGDFE